MHLLKILLTGSTKGKTIKNMKKVKKYTTFEALKSSEQKNIGEKVSLQRHGDFEKIMKHIYSARIQPNTRES
jgi:hypothetical protein